ncbi:MAG: hypothetical protein NT062_34095 [Proteobacteria bacterium]|nr:hypothetical protein [Pseudomonadota bacterium]
MRARWLVAAVVLTSSVASAQPKDAPTVDCELFEVSLTTTKAPPPLDPALKPLEKKLAKPPFSTWNTATLLSHTTKTLAKLKNEAFPVKVGKAAVMFENQTGKSQLQLTIQVDNSKGKRVLGTKIVIEGSDYFMTSRDDGTQHVLALTCKASK